MADAYIVSAVRTPAGKAPHGALRYTRPDELAAIAITEALRRARDGADFLARLVRDGLVDAARLLSGEEEAAVAVEATRLRVGATREALAVIDVGGGSTECVLGKRFSALYKDSLRMGCVGFTQRFFSDGRLTRKAFRKAEVTAKLEFEPMQRRYREAGWEECVGSSGTVNAVCELARGLGAAEGVLTLRDVKALRRALIAAERVDKLDLAGLQPDRAEVLAGGLAIVKAAFESLGIERLRPSKAALREGVLYDLLGRIRHEDVRDRTIRALSERYHVDADQAERVERTVLRCLAQVAEGWKLQREGAAQLLVWAARMHEIGLALTHSGHHKHGAYILTHSDMPGFARQEQLRLAALVGGHRRKLGKTAFADFPNGWPDTLLRLCVLLRLAVRLHRSRSPRGLPSFELKIADDGLTVRLPGTWLERHPLSSADLEEEDGFLADCGIRLRVETL